MLMPRMGFRFLTLPLPVRAIEWPQWINYRRIGLARALLSRLVPACAAVLVCEQSRMKRSPRWPPIATIRRTTMLVLSRKRWEMIQIGDDVTIKVIQTGRNTVKIG